jgi:hypothetical protein
MMVMRVDGGRDVLSDTGGDAMGGGMSVWRCNGEMKERW